MTKRPEPPFLKAIEVLYEKTRKKIKPLYPYDKRIGKVELPE